ncbi:hypothetical protein [Thalassotalea litorea]|uniref:hypothetical protein n=1 Tax=Thalassotalea litorea TaxID=2020715 RepID=UPI003735731C
MNPHCHICNRELEVKGDPLSIDCGGDCWGCIGEIEAGQGYEPSVVQVRKEFLNGLRPDWMPSPETSYEMDSETRLHIKVKLSRPLGEPWSGELFELKIISKESPMEEELIERALLSTSSNGECIYASSVDTSINGPDLWYYIVRKGNEWGYPVSVVKYA